MSRVHRAGPDAPIEFGCFAGGITSVARKQVRVTQVQLSQKSAVEGMRQPALQGWACVYGKLHSYKGCFDVFTSGVFDDTLSAKSRVNFQLDHDDDFIIGSTEDKLQLHSDEKGLGFRFSLEDNGIAEMVKERKCDGVSVAYEPLEIKNFMIEGQTVRLIKKARLTEISLVTRGAVKQAFATLVDAAEVPSLAVEMKTASFGGESAYRRMMRLMDDLRNR